MRTRTAAIMVTLAVAALGTACSGQSTMSTLPAVVAKSSPAERQTDTSALTRLAKQTAVNNSDSRVKTARYVVTTRNAALRLDNAGESNIDGNARVTFVVMTGHFTAYGASIPYGAKPPTGTVLSFTFDASAGRILDLGLDSRSMDLSSLGPVKTLHLG